MEEEIQNDVVEETTPQDTVVETTPVEDKAEPADTNEGILDYLKGAWNSVTGGSETEEDTSGSDKEEQVDETPSRTEDQPIPSAFLEAAKADGWSTKDTEEFAGDKTDEELLELIPHLVEEEEEEETEPKTEPEEPEKEQVTSEDTDADLEALKSSIKEEVRNELLQEYGSKLDVLDDFRAEQTSRSNIEAFETANDLMDGASKDLPVFGTFEKIPRFTAGPREGEPVPTSPAYKARAEVFELAADLMETGRYGSMKDATNKALACYRGEHGQKEMERKVVRNLKTHEKKLSGSRTGKETKREFANDREEILDYIRQSQKAAGS